MDWNHKKKRAGIKAHRDKLPNSKVLLEAEQKLEQARMREASKKARELSRRDAKRRKEAGQEA
ncbi:MAG: hypothetical protein HN930_03995 [Pelagibacterales bacterium]|jgi:hypothetical protein|nr:hypothetical protein [Pelagibacterales bacterium]MBT7076861.1 hypothetical protein [Pelagibacterales bacterium]